MSADGVVANRRAAHTAMRPLLFDFTLYVATIDTHTNINVNIRT